MAIYQAGLELEKGKLCLTRKDFGQSQAHFAAANKFYHKPKLTLLEWLLWLSPNLTLRLFKTLRPAEFSFIAPGNLQK